MKINYRRRLLVGGAVLLGVIFSLLGLHYSGSPPSIEIESGDMQADLPGHTLTQPLVIRIFKLDGPGSILTFCCFDIDSGGTATPVIQFVSNREQMLVKSIITLPSASSYIGKTLNIRGRVFNIYGISKVSFSVRIGNPELPPEAPGQPILTEQHNHARVLIEWDDRSDNETAFYVERTDDGAHWERIATVTRNTTSYVDQTVVMDKVYFYRIVAHNDAP